MISRFTTTGSILVVLGLLWLVAPPVSADRTVSPPWGMLEFERKSVWGTANSRIELNKRSQAELAGAWHNPSRQDYLVPAGDGTWELDIAATVGRNQARLQLLLEPATAAIYQRDRLTIGRKDRRNKFYRYHAGGVTRIRRDPLPQQVALPALEWSQTSLQELSFPKLPADAIVTTPYALLVLVSAVPLAAGETFSVYIHTDYNLYRVQLERGDSTRLQASFQLHADGGQTTLIDEARAVESITLQVEATALAPDKPDFDLLGLGGEVSVLLDSETRLPLRVLGTAPRVGKTHLDLIAATLPANDIP